MLWLEKHRAPRSAVLMAVLWTVLVALSLLAGAYLPTSGPVADAGHGKGGGGFQTVPGESLFLSGWPQAAIWLLGLLGIAMGTRHLLSRLRVRLRAQHSVNLNEARLEALLQLHHQSRAPLGELARLALEQSVRLTESRLGYLAFIEEDEKILTLHTWPQETVQESPGQDRSRTFPLMRTEHWAEAMRQRRSLTVNDLDSRHRGKRDDPETAVTLHRHMHVPVWDDQRLVILAGVGNKPTGYERSDERQVTLLMSELWRIVKQQRAEDEIRHLNKSLEQRVRERTAQWETANQELEAFNYSVSHDLRAPLRAILGFSKILAEKSNEKLDAEGNDCLQVICNEAERMRQLIDGLLSLSRVGKNELHPLPVEMTQMVREVYALLTAQMSDRKVDLRLQPLPSAAADPVLLRQVWTNLLDNALKYTRDCETAVIEIAGHSRNGEHIYSIRDNGAGFDRKYADKLFQVFQRLHRADEFEGSGVGLAIVRRIVHRHQGRVWAESEPGCGATFSFSLNAAKSQDVSKLVPCPPRLSVGHP